MERVRVSERVSNDVCVGACEHVSVRVCERCV